MTLNNDGHILKNILFFEPICSSMLWNLNVATDSYTSLAKCFLPDLSRPLSKHEQ